MERTMLRGAYKNLGNREKEILSLRFFDGKTQMEVAGKLGISQAQVSRLEKKGLIRLTQEEELRIPVPQAVEQV